MDTKTIIDLAITKLETGEPVSEVTSFLTKHRLANRVYESPVELLEYLRSEEYDPLPRIEFDESSLSRVLHHHSQTGFAILTAWRDEYSNRENRIRNADLLADIRAAGAGAIRLLGSFKENREESFLVPKPEGVDFDDFSREMYNLGRKYDQDSVLVHKPGAGTFLYTHGGAVQVGTENVTIGDLEDTYSALRNKPNVKFRFEGAMWPKSMVVAMYLDSAGLIGSGRPSTWFWLKK